MIQPFQSLARRALTLPLGTDLLTALTAAAGSGGPLALRLLPSLPPPLEQRGLLPLLAGCGLGRELPRGHAGIRLLQAAALHERARLTEIDRVVQPLLDRLSQDRLPAPVIGAYDHARYFPDRAWRHVHNVTLLCPTLEDDSLLWTFGFKPADTPISPNSRLFRHTNGFELRLTTSPLPPSFPDPLVARLRHRILTEGRTKPEVAGLLCIATLLTAKPVSAALALVDLYFILQRVEVIEALLALSYEYGLDVLVLSTLSKIGCFLGSGLEPASPGNNTWKVDRELVTVDDWMIEFLLRLCRRRADVSLFRVMIEAENWRVRQRIFLVLYKWAGRRIGLDREGDRYAAGSQRGSDDQHY